MRKLVASTMVSLDVMQGLAARTKILPVASLSAAGPSPASDFSAVTAATRSPRRDLQIIGSGQMIQTLQAAALIDEYNLWTFPVVLGRGKRQFETGAKAGALRLVASRTSATGVVMSTCVPAGEIAPGSFAQGRAECKGRQRHRKNYGYRLGALCRHDCASVGFWDCSCRQNTLPGHART